MPPTIASHVRHVPTVKIALFHGSLNVTTAPTIDAATPMTPQANSTGVDATLTSSNFCGNARLTRKTSPNRSTIDKHQMTVTAAWKTRYTCAGKLPFCAHGPNVTTEKIDAITVCARIALTGTLRSFTFPSAAGSR